MRLILTGRRIALGSSGAVLSALLGLASVGIGCSGDVGPLHGKDAGIGEVGGKSPVPNAASAAATASESGLDGASTALADAAGAAESVAAAGSASASAGSGGESVGAATSVDAGTSLPTSDGPPVPPKICDALNQVFKTTCGGGSCHTSQGVAIGDWGFSAASALKYVERPSVRDPKCGFIIDSSDYSKSLMLVKLEGPIPDGCGGPMPVGSYGGITKDQIDCVASWLQQFQKPR
jgi:hypothetical protein